MTNKIQQTNMNKILEYKDILKIEEGGSFDLYNRLVRLKENSNYTECVAEYVDLMKKYRSNAWIFPIPGGKSIRQYHILKNLKEIEKDGRYLYDLSYFKHCITMAILEYDAQYPE